MLLEVTQEVGWYRTSHGQGRTASDAAIADIGVRPEMPANVRQIIVVFDRIAVLLPLVVQETVMQHDVVKTQQIPGRFDVHFADALGVIPGGGQRAGQRGRIAPFHPGVVTGKAVTVRPQAGHQGRPGGNAARTGGIGPGKVDAFPGQLVEVRRVKVVRTVDAQRVAPHLVDDDQ